MGVKSKKTMKIVKAIPNSSVTTKRISAESTFTLMMAARILI